jgi:hypothetical protein
MNRIGSIRNTKSFRQVGGCEPYLQTDTSDINLMIVSENSFENDDMTTGKIWSLTRKVSTKIEPYLVGNDRFNNDSNSPLIQIVKAEGIVIL